VNPVESTRDGVSIRLHIQPRAARTEVAGVFGDALKIRLKSPPVDGAANAELIDLLAEILDVPKRSIVIVSGERQRTKRVRVDGVSRDQLVRAIPALA